MTIQHTAFKSTLVIPGPIVILTDGPFYIDYKSAGTIDQTSYL